VAGTPRFAIRRSLEPETIQIGIVRHNIQPHFLAHQGLQVGSFPLDVVLDTVNIHRFAVVEMKSFFEVCLSRAILDHPVRQIGLKRPLATLMQLVDADGHLDYAAACIDVQLQ